MRVLCVVGTRPEAIKMAPVIAALRDDPRFDCRVCATGQHGEMLRQALSCFDIEPDVDLAVMTDRQTLNSLAAAIFTRLDPVLVQERPDLVLVHGDTTTAMAAAVGAFQLGVPVGHVEAGLRTGDLKRPWPEEMNRRVIDAVAQELFAPTAAARVALAGESLAGRITVTGNTVVDALQMAIDRLDAGGDRHDPGSLHGGGARPLVLATCHRRENFGGSLDGICEALERLGSEDFDVLVPVHRNPAVRSVIEARFSKHPHVHLAAPLDYLAFVAVMRRAAVILTDSGGVQEEAASLGKPLIVMREITERPEGLVGGGAHLVGSDPARIVEAVRAAVRATPIGASPLSDSPYGDGRAASRIVAVLAGEDVEEFSPAPVRWSAARRRGREAA